ncbi:MAG TPA: N-acetyltransferase family protein [Methylomusa anaerophila]|uniref:N-acyltransferase YncA n=1 Tax=Methylomusa anaerophila TaxID=1930071 RepID=A0A348AJP8_9FIRM|nr:GNAT family N-acetyltransferase [Methylomusa anaerophila]BBB91296.1 N-acyltransferase YncA [Methylomusa anaerophila]HML90704.1 N-acetyltransferase family protein [Methylomusa anaerophila]
MIRHAQERDLPEILAIYNDAIIHTTAVYEWHPQTLEDRWEWYRGKKQTGFPIIVCEMDHMMLGFATFGLYRDLSGFKYTVADSVYVHEHHRCKQVGTGLLRELVKIAANQDFVTMVAEIDSANESSKRMHEKVGFKNAGVISKAGFKFGTWLDLAIYQYDLNGV